ncbi:MAG TPA: hypothetical protein VJ299_00910, partial [Steroidobacteraceae bacterium]|nr:hypothetical protein [Steroidobacteraceae bacterium]
AGLRAANPGSAAQIDDLLTQEKIFGSDDFGAGETNDAGDPGILPVYKTILLNAPISVCSRMPDGSTDANKVGNRVLLRFDNDAQRLVTITAAGAVNGGGTVAATDPDIFVLRRGTLAAFGVSTVAGSETISQQPLEAGTYVIEVYDFNIAGTQPRCMSVSIQGN